MNLIATNPIDLGRREHRLISCGFAGDEIDFSCKSSKFSRLEVKEELQLTNPIATTAPLQYVYLHQCDAGTISRYRAWAEWLSECRTRAILGELIPMEGNDPTPALTRASVHDWQVLIYEPPGYTRPACGEVRP